MFSVDIYNRFVVDYIKDNPIDVARLVCSTKSISFTTRPAPRIDLQPALRHIQVVVEERAGAGRGC